MRYHRFISSPRGFVYNSTKRALSSKRVSRVSICVATQWCFSCPVPQITGKQRKLAGTSGGSWARPRSWPLWLSFSRARAYSLSLEAVLKELGVLTGAATRLSSRAALSPHCPPAHAHMCFLFKARVPTPPPNPPHPATLAPSLLPGAPSSCAHIWSALAEHQSMRTWGRDPARALHGAYRIL